MENPGVANTTSNQDAVARIDGATTPPRLDATKEIASQNARIDISPTSSPSGTEQTDAKPEYMKGWRLYTLTAGIWISLFLSTLETTIVSTSLVSIADSLNGFNERNWVVTAYFLTYTGFLVIYAKLSSIFGTKTMFILALTIFTVFSIACGSAHTMTQLIILRAFQGIGGSGIYSMVLVIAPKLVPVTEYGKYIGIISSVFALASITGPLVGGAIATNTSWRWVFLLNGPPGVVAILMIAIFLPASKVDTNLTFSARLRAKFSRETTQRVDILGCLSLLAASVLLVFALESGGSQYPWNSAPIIATFTLSGLSWILFITWELYLEKTNTAQEPIFPMRLLKDRQLTSMMFNTFFTGFPFVTILFLIPQHAQAVYGVSPVQASLSVLPLLLTSPAATAFSGVLTSTFNIPPAYLIIIGSAIGALAVGLAITIPLTGNSISAKQYGFEAMMGVGFGLSLSTVLTLGQLLVDRRDAGVLLSALTQVRILGGTVALAICSATLRNNLLASLTGVLTPLEFGEISETLEAINRLGPEREARVKLAFAEGYRLEFWVLMGCSVAAVVAAGGLRVRGATNVRDVAEEKGEGK